MHEDIEMTKIVACLVSLPLVMILSMAIPTNCQKVLGGPKNLPGEPGINIMDDIVHVITTFYRIL